MAVDQTQIDAIRDSVSEDLRTGIQSTSVDGTTVTASNPMLRLEAADHLEDRRGGRGSRRGLYFNQIIPPGAG